MVTNPTLNRHARSCRCPSCTRLLRRSTFKRSDGRAHFGGPVLAATCKCGEVVWMDRAEHDRSRRGFLDSSMLWRVVRGLYGSRLVRLGLTLAAIGWAARNPGEAMALVNRFGEAVEWVVSRFA